VGWLNFCRDEIRRHEHLARSLSHLFDRFDLLLEASAGWRKLYGREAFPDSLLQLLAASWYTPFAELRAPLMNVLRAIAAVPQRWLDHFDLMQEHAPATLALLGPLLDQLEDAGDSPERHDHDELTGLVLALLPQLNVAGYQSERLQLMRFCLREDVSPEEIAEVARGFTDGWEELGTLWAQSLSADWPLRYLCRAYRLFYA
jgi:hypothetical protein